MVKRTFDIVSSVVGMIILFPLLPLIALSIKLDSRGPVFYTQVRVGINRRKNHGPVWVGRERRRIFTSGKLFTMYKFRSMTTDAEKNGAQWSTKNDIRVTRVGKILRKTHIDELPQLWNVFVGEMSLVGPRPERPIFVSKLRRKVLLYDKRHKIVPGITGLAQILNGYDDSIDSVRQKIVYDLDYVEKNSLLRDIKIILSTLKLYPKEKTK